MLMCISTEKQRLHFILLKIPDVIQNLQVSVKWELGYFKKMGNCRKELLWSRCEGPQSTASKRSWSRSWDCSGCSWALSLPRLICWAERYRSPPSNNNHMRQPWLMSQRSLVEHFVDLFWKRVERGLDKRILRQLPIRLATCWQTSFRGAQARSGKHSRVWPGQCAGRSLIFEKAKFNASMFCRSICWFVDCLFAASSV